jgi:hypothetical protein
MEINVRNLKDYIEQGNEHWNHPDGQYWARCLICVRRTGFRHNSQELLLERVRQHLKKIHNVVLTNPKEES